MGSLRLYSVLTIALTSLLTLPFPAQAVEHEVRILLDLDNDVGTGCLVNTIEGPFDGVEQVLISTVETTSSPDAGVVTDVALSDCDETTDTFDSPISFDGSWSVGVGNGVSGRDVVETYVPLLSLVIQNPSIVHLGVVVTDEQGGEEALLTVDDTPDGEPILLSLQSILEIPTLSEWGGLLLILLLVTLAFRALSRRETTAFLVLLALAGASGAVWAAGTLDGLVDDWTAGDQLATDTLVLFGKGGGDELVFRVDVDLLFNQPLHRAFLTSSAFTGDMVVAANNLAPPNSLSVDYDCSADAYNGGQYTGDGDSGVEAADCLCRASASGAALECPGGGFGCWKAWISDGGGPSEPASRFAMALAGSDVPILQVDTNGAPDPTAPIAVGGWIDLVVCGEGAPDPEGSECLDDPSIVPTGWRDGTGVRGGFTAVWTNTVTAGLQAGLSSCDNWGSESSVSLGRTGASDTRSTGWTSSADSSCDTQSGLYCFEDFVPE